MVSYISSAVALAGFGGAYCLLVARPFMPPELKPLVLPFAILFFGVPWLLIPIINKLFLGVYLLGSRLTPEQVDALRQAAQKRRRENFLLAIVFLAVSLPAIFLMKEFGGGLTAMMAVVSLSFVLVRVFNFVYLKYGLTRSSPLEDGKTQG
jgi:hypothetical protein